jgi:mRNA interferase YafQ
MRTIEYTTAFRRDFNRERKGRHGRRLDGLLAGVVALLADDRPLPAGLHDHALSGEFCDFRDCHLKPDLVLVYRKPSTDTVQLVRLGSHTALFG